MQSETTIAVTGASGLVGGHTCTHLAGKGFRVIAIARRREKLSELQNQWQSARLSIETRLADVCRADELERALIGADVVVHAAASVDPYGSRQSIFDTNVGGTLNAISAAKTCGVKQFIHISSLSVITGQGDQFDVDESEPLKPCGEAYADSKVEAERLVMTAGEQWKGSLAVTILRPGFIYCPGEKAWMPRLINSIRTGKAMLIDGGLKETNVIYIENLSRAISAAVLNERAYQQVYNLTDGQKISKKQLFDAIADGLDLPRVRKVIPSVIARPACELISAIAPLMPVDTQRKLSRFSRAAFRLAGVNQGFSIAKAERDLNYVDRIPFESGMKETLASFRNGSVREFVQTH